MKTAPIILVPGFWLGAWAWEEVAALLRADGHQVTALTLPGLESAEADRSAITLSDHVDAIVEAIRAADAPVVLAVHSASGFSGYAASDREPGRIAAMVYVDTAPGMGALDPDFKDVEKPMVWTDIAGEENLDGLTEEQNETFRQRAVPVPGGVLRESVELTNDARRDIPSTVIATGYTSEQYQSYAKDHPEWAFLAGLPELRNVTWVDLPTSHWPMWSRPQDIARIIGDLARAHAPRRAMTGSLLDDAFAHHVWATERLIDACRALTPEQIRTPAPGTYGSILDTWRHLAEGERLYLSVLRGSANEPLDAEASLVDLGSELSRNGKAWEEILASATHAGADVVEHDNGWQIHVPMATRLAQVIHHGTDHRSQICTALSSLAVAPPEIDVWAFAEATGRTRVVPPPAP